MRTFGLIPVLLALSGCGLDELGVLSIHFTLDPTEPSEVPVELDGLFDPETVHAASGTVEADVVDGLLTLDAHGLPDPPEGWAWIPMLELEHDEREGFPGAVSLEGGHAHGARATGPDGGEDEASMMDALVQVGDGEWSGVRSGSKVDGKPLGALRTAMVMLMPEDAMMGGPTLMVLHGEVSFEEDAEGGAAPAEEEEGGHSHGV